MDLSKATFVKTHYDATGYRLDDEYSVECPDCRYADSRVFDARGPGIVWHYCKGCGHEDERRADDAQLPPGWDPSKDKEQK